MSFYMSLRLRLSLLITLVFLLILVATGYVVIENARRAIEDEIHSSAQLTLQLIEIAFASVEEKQADKKISLVEEISELESSRHLTIDLIRHSNSRHAPFFPERAILADAPDWFVQRVKPVPIEFRRTLPTPNLPIELVIKANPSDEITEAWNETKGVLILLTLFVLIAITLVYYTLGRGLKPIDNILHALEEIEQGNYQLRLPDFNLPELSKISQKFNHMAAVMQKSRDENRALTQRSLAIQEQERQDLAYALHDELGQSITAVKAVAASIKSQDQSVTEINKSVDAIIDVSDQMYDVARTMIQRLRPSVLDELGIVRALQEMIDDWNVHHGDLFCHFNFFGQLDKLGDTINIMLYRIVQESLTNVAKHAEADSVHINIHRTLDIKTNNDSQSKETGAGEITLFIEDNGIGFDTNKTSQGLGLLGMRERVESLGGEISIDSSEDNGVEIKVTIPCEQ